MTARSMWKGAITFGLVSVPVKLYLATESTAKVSFNSLHKECLSRINVKTHCPEHGEIARTDTVKGYEWSRGQYVVLTDDELENLALPSAKTVEIGSFCPTTDDLGHVKQSYYMAPEPVGARAFDLLRRAMEEGGVRAVAKVTLRDRESMCVIEAKGGGMVMSTLYWPDEIRDQAEYVVPVKTEPSAAEMAMGRQLIEALTAPFDASQYTDLYRDAVLKLVEQKAEGLTAFVADPTPAAPVKDKADDLMAVLTASLNASRARKADAKATKKKAKVASA